MLEWKYNACNDHYRAEITGGRTFDIEADSRRQALWFGKPGRRLLIGKFRDVDEAKAVAKDVAVDLLRLAEQTSNEI